MLNLRPMLLVVAGVCCFVALTMFILGAIVTWGFLVPIGYILGVFIVLFPWPPPLVDTRERAAKAVRTRVARVWSRPSPTPASSNRSAMAPFIVAILSGAVVLLITSLLYQAGRDYQERMFAQPTTVAFDRFVARITYPNTLWREPPDKRGLPLMVELLRTTTAFPTPPVTPTAPAATVSVASTAATTATAVMATQTSASPTSTPTPTFSYTLLFSPTDALAFSDVDAKPVPPRMSLSDARPLAAIYLRPAPITAMTSITLEAREEHAASGSSPALLRMALESSGSARWRLLSARLLGDAGLPLSVAIAIVGWTLETNRQQREERLEAERQQREERLEAERQQREEWEKEWQALVDSILETKPSDSVRAIVKYHSLKKGGLKDLTQEHDEQIRERINLLNNNEMRDRLLILAGDHLREQNEAKFREVIAAIQEIFPETSFNSDIKIISDSILNLSEKGVKNAASAAQRMYTTYPTSREMCVYLICKLFNFASVSSSMNPMINDIIAVFRQPGESLVYVEGRDLLVDGRVISIMYSFDAAKKIADELLSLPRNWIVKFTTIVDRELLPSLDNEANEWWKERQIYPERLSQKNIAEDPVLDELVMKVADLVSKAGDRHVYLGDKLLAELALHHIIRQISGNNPKLLAMPVQLWLPFATEMMSGTPDLPVHFVAQAIGERWFSIVCTYPEWFFNLRSPAKQLVLQLLAWTAGSYETCWFKMEELTLAAFSEQQDRARGEAARKLVLHELRLLFERVGCPNPSHAELRSWLRLRPGNVTATLLLVQFEPSEETDAGIKMLGRYAPLLEQANIYLVLCGSTMAPLMFPHLDLTKDMELFKAMLDRLIATAGEDGGISSFDELISRVVSKPEREELIEGLIVRANGSLSRLMESVASVVAQHVKNTSKLKKDQRNYDRYYDLWPEDFEAVLFDPGTSS